jgi:hypothetical protein
MHRGGGEEMVAGERCRGERTTESGLMSTLDAVEHV